MGYAASRALDRVELPIGGQRALHHGESADHTAGYRKCCVRARVRGPSLSVTIRRSGPTRPSNAARPSTKNPMRCAPGVRPDSRDLLRLAVPHIQNSVSNDRVEHKAIRRGLGRTAPTSTRLRKALCSTRQVAHLQPNVIADQPLAGAVSPGAIPSTWHSPTRPQRGGNMRLDRRRLRQACPRAVAW
jgi:hypothetical protein